MGLRTVLSVFSLVVLSACGSGADGAPSFAGEPSPPSSSASRPAPAPPRASAPDAPLAPPQDGPRGQALGAPYPIVLMHGMGGFEQLGLGPISIQYWAGVREALAGIGETEVYTTEVSPYDSSEARAGEAARQIDAVLARTNKAKVLLVAHSQGGLDARVLVSPNGLGYGDRVASVTTLSTPHHGTRVADIAMRLVNVAPREFDEATSAILRLLQRSLYDLQNDPELRLQLNGLSERYMRETFNPKYIDDPRVRYESYAGRSHLRAGLGVCDGGAYPNEPLKLDAIQSMLLASALLIEEGLPPKVNDGLVTVSSAKWGSFMQCIPADHMKEVGHIGSNLGAFDHKGFFRSMVQRLRARGL